MPNNELIQRVRIYLNERDTSEGQALYLEVLDRLRQEGATGATALRGIAGFGSRSGPRTSNGANLTNASVVIEWVDRAERITRVLPRLDELLPTALITIEDIQIYRAMLRSGGIFGEQTVGDAMQGQVVTLPSSASVRAAAEAMLEHNQALLPICDESGALVGVLTSSDLVHRAELALPLWIFRALTNAERRVLLERLPARPVAEIMSSEPRSAYIEAAIPIALSPMVEWGIATLPVLDHAGQVAGLFSVAQVLKATLNVQPKEDVHVRNSDQPTPVGLVMQHNVPTIAAATPLPETLTKLLAAPDRFLVVLDEGRPIGILTDLQLVQQLTEPLRSIWLSALRIPSTPLPAVFEYMDQTADSIAKRDVPVVSMRATQEEAIRIMLEGDFERLVVVDEESGHVQGLLARRGLLRALAQVSVST